MDRIMSSCEYHKKSRSRKQKDDATYAIQVDIGTKWMDHLHEIATAELDHGHLATGAACFVVQATNDGFN